MQRVGIGRLPAFNPSRLRALRAEAQLSAVDLADLVGVTDQTVASWESGAASPDPRRAARLAQVLGVRVRDLTTLRDDEMGLAEYRVCTGRIMQDLSDLLGISRNTLRAIEAGRREPSPDLTAQLAEALELTAEDVRRIWQRTRVKRLRALEGRLRHTEQT